MILNGDKSRVWDFLPRRSEANLQAEFYKQATNRGLNIFLEYCSRWNETPGARFDAVIHAAGKIRALCEIKKSPNPAKRRRTWPQSRQAKSYLSWDIPVFLILIPEDFKEVWGWAESAGLIPPTQSSQ
jgi:hypothetical protein